MSIYQGDAGRPDRVAFLTDEPALESVYEATVGFIERSVAESDAEGVVVAMSGGIDSTVTAALAADALGSDRVIGLGLPRTKRETLDVSDARTIAEGMGLEYHEANVRPLLEEFTDALAPAIEPAESDGEDDPPHLAVGNVVSRLRMCCAYYVANRSSHLVLGTANRSELLLGYFTKYGDGGVDLNPIGDLYKTEVRALARHLGLPKRIVSKEPTAGFWTGQTDASELGAPYEQLDPLLRRTVDRGEPLEDAVADLDIDAKTAREIVSRCVETRHKRFTPPTPGIGARHAEVWSSTVEE
ncbi:NAD+ synthase [Natronobiforma cellulositropha]|uniref:NAD+ synthase n=1 Tax=Natronobiforma cellulositropha TaxID=1679076 RepID=UPI0021D612C7|nr:NAD+ synthase [Natronobiforma cellulositropha]